jgi:hypothetical protein
MSVIQDGGRQTASKPEVVISQLLVKQQRRSKGFSHILVVQQLSGTIAATARCNVKSEFHNNVLKYSQYIGFLWLIGRNLGFLTSGYIVLYPQ